MGKIIKEDDASRKLVRPGRPRDPATQEAILAASLRLTERKGYARLTMEGIAAEAGVGKQTVYRWWSSKAAVVLEAFAREAAAVDEKIRATGDREADLAAFLIAVHFRLDGRGGVVFRSLLAESLINSEFATALFGQYLKGRVEELKIVLGGEEIEGDLLGRVIEMTYGAIWYRLATRQPLTDAVARQLAGAVIRILDAHHK